MSLDEKLQALKKTLQGTSQGVPRPPATPVPTANPELQAFMAQQQAQSVAGSGGQSFMKRYGKFVIIGIIVLGVVLLFLKKKKMFMFKQRSLPAPVLPPVVHGGSPWSNVPPPQQNAQYQQQPPQHPQPQPLRRPRPQPQQPQQPQQQQQLAPVQSTPVPVPPAPKAKDSDPNFTPLE